MPADIPRHASYIADWLKPLKDDKREIFRAGADAQRIVDMVLGFHADFAAKIAAQPDRRADRRFRNQKHRAQQHDTARQTMGSP